MKLKFLLWILFICSFQFLKAQDNVIYNGKVRIEIRVKEIAVYDIHDHDGYAEPHAYFDINDGDQIGDFTKSISRDVKSWVPIYSHSKGWLLYSTNLNLSKTTLQSYFSGNDVKFRMSCYEHDGGHKSLWQYLNFSIKSILVDHGDNPGFHEFTQKTDVGNFRVKIEYTITPPTPTIEDFEIVAYGEDSDIVLKCNPIGGGVKYEWLMNIDGELKQLYRFDQGVYDQCVHDNYNNGEPISNRPVEEGAERGEYPDCEAEAMVEDGTEVIWQSVYETGARTNITDASQIVYHFPEFRGFSKNYQFIVYAYAKGSSGRFLRSPDFKRFKLVNVYPRFPTISNLLIKEVSCNLGSTLTPLEQNGSISFKIHGDLGKDVSRYEVKLTGPVNPPKQKLTQSECTFTGLKSGIYSLLINSIVAGEEVPVGHLIQENIKVGQPEELDIDSFDIVYSKNSCGQFKISNLKASGGAGDYKYSLTQDGTYGLGDKILTVNRSNFGSNYTYNIWVQDKNGCKKSESKKIVLPAQLQINAPDEKKKLHVKCFGKTVAYSIDAQGGFEKYNYKMDDGSFSNNKNFTVSEGTHTFHVQDDNGCISSATRTFTQNPKININVSDITPVNCYGEQTGNIKVKASGGVSPYTFRVGKQENAGITSGENTDFIVKANTYQIEVTDKESCAETLKDVKVTQPKSEISVIAAKPKYLDANGKSYHFKAHNAPEEISISISGGTGDNYELKYGSLSKSGENVSFELAEVNPEFFVSDEKCKNKNVKLTLQMPEKLKVSTKTNEYKSSGISSSSYQIKKHGATDTLFVHVEGGVSAYTVRVKGEGEDGDGKKMHAKSTNDFFLNDLRKGTYDVKVETQYETYQEKVIKTLTEPEILEMEVNLPDTKNKKEVWCKGDGAGKVKFLAKGGIKNYNLIVNKDGKKLFEESNFEESVEKIGLKAGEYTFILKDKYGTETEKKSYTVHPGEEKVVKDAEKEADVSENKFTLREPEKALTFNILTSNYNGYEIRCAGLTDSVDVMIEGGIKKYTIEQSTSTATTIKNDSEGDTPFHNLTAQNYSYKVTDDNGCYEEKTITLSQPELLKITSMPPYQPSCNHEDMGDDKLKNDGRFELIWKGGIFKKTYQLDLLKLENNKKYKEEVKSDQSSDISSDPPLMTFFFTDLATGMYNVKVTDDNACADSMLNKKLGEPDLLLIHNHELKMPNCYKESNGELAMDLKGGSITNDNTYSYALNGVDQQKIGLQYTQKGLKAGAYQVEIRDDHNCLYKETFDMPQPDSLVNQLLLVGNDVLNRDREIEFDCFGSGKESKLIVTGGTDSYSTELKKDGVLVRSFNNVPEGIETWVEPLFEGRYSIQTIDSHGCESADVEFELTYPEEIEFSHEMAQFREDISSNLYDYDCSGVSNLIDVKIDGGFAPYSISYKDEQKTIEKNGSSTDYVVSGKKPEFNIVDAKGCEKAYMPTLNEPDPLELSVSKKYYFSHETSEKYNIKCKNATDTIWAEAKGSIRPYTYELFADHESSKSIERKISNEKVFFANLSAGKYFVKVSGAYNEDCYQEKKIELNEPEALDATVQVSDHNGFQIRCYNLTDSVKVEALGGIYPYTIELKGEGKELKFEDIEAGINTFKGLGAGTYNIRITDKYQACEYNKQVILTEPSVLDFEIQTSLYEGNYHIRCSYLKDSVTIVPSGSLPEANHSRYKITQEDAMGNRSIGNANFDGEIRFRNLDEGKYTYTVTDNNACVLSKSKTLLKPDSLEITGIDFTIPSCHENDMGDFSKRSNGKIKLAAKGGVPFTGGTYDFLLNKMPNSDPKDRLDSIRKQREVDFEHLETGEYIVEVKDANACRIVKKKQNLSQPALLRIENLRTRMTQCYETKDGFWTSTIKGGTTADGNYTYSIHLDGEAFRNGETASTFDHDQLGKGNYTIEINDDLGCYYRKEKEVLQPDPIEIDFDVMGVTAIGSEDGIAQVRVKGGNGAYKYQWHHKGSKMEDATTTRIENLPAGEYIIEVWDKNYCPYGNNSFGRSKGLEKSVTIKAPGSKLGLVVVPVRTSYAGASDGALQVSGVGGWPFTQWPGYEFSIDGGAWKIASQFNNLKAGEHEIQVRDRKGVVESTKVIIEEPDEILISTETQNCLCFGGSEGSVQLSVTGGTPPYTYAFNERDNFQTEAVFMNLLAGNYEIFVKDKLGYIESAEIEITQPDALQITVKDIVNSTCNSSNGSAKIEISGGEPEYNIDWGDHYFENLYSPSSMSAGTYQVNVSDQNNCSVSATFAIEEMSGPEIVLKKITEVSCHESKDAQIEIEIENGKAPLDIVWEAQPDHNTTQISGLGKGAYKVTVNDGNNCFDEKEYEVSGPEALNLIVNSIQSPNCVGIDDGLITLSAEGGTPSYQFRMNEESNSEGVFDGLGAGNKHFGVIDSHGCENMMDAELSAPVPLVIDLPEEYFLCMNQTEYIESGIPNVKSKWFYEGEILSSENEVDLFDEGNYTLQVTSEKGCEAQHDFTIHHLDYNAEADFIVPAEAIVGDTIIAVDISWEMPDSIRWNIPKSLEKIDREGATIWFKVKEAGSIKLGLTIFKKECNDYIEKPIKVTGSSTKRKAQLIQPDDVYIKDAILYPNPNRGDFHLKVTLNRVEDVEIEVYDMSKAMKIDQRKGQNSAIYTFDFNDRSIFKPNNAYSILIGTGKERRSIKFIVY